MQGTLVLTILSVQSSYVLELERPLSEAACVPDTVQWWVAPSGAWRVRTYAIDHDIHTYSIGFVENLTEIALANSQKHYGDVIESNHIIELKNCHDAKEVEVAFRAKGLEPRIEIADGRFAFWKPDDAQYRTQSEPK